MIHIPDTILKRKDQREGELQKKHDNQPSQAEVFRETFREKEAEIEVLLASIEKTTDKLDLADMFDRISKSINQLNKYLASSSIFLIAYDIKISKSAIQSLQDRSVELENKYLPRKRFTFKNRRDMKPARDKNTEIDRHVEVEKIVTNPNAFSVSDKTDVTLFIDHEDIKNKDVTLSRLVNCVVFIHGSPNTLHLITLESCRIVSGPVVTSVLVEDSRNGSFAFPCQQLRVHNTKSTDFHIHVTTRAIIEDTSGVRFGPYRYSYDNLDAHYEGSGLDRERNNWDDVDDFNWLVNNKQSPNWTKMPPNDQDSFLEELKPYLKKNKST
ncbi:hypothetical protein GE061_004890 [Apolygus lucorum]|uniref:C-CAP/cofactor C-like domain-containing protein n=1 Tax=Apolygus lucorum TaxID=248454 RepID=A0A8S9WUT6_APOLU|nr:hypothetical protein GE061_004890 [Apolygus lucorum]